MTMKNSTNSCPFAALHHSLGVDLCCFLQVDENMKNCQKRNAVLEQKLWFRRDLFRRDSDMGDDASQMTVSEIINGKVTTLRTQ